MHRAVIMLGSNIQPETNIPEAIRRLSTAFCIAAISNTYETCADGSTGPNFLNTAVLLETSLDVRFLKEELTQMEKEMGRVRTADKNAPRTIDLDILCYDGDLHEPRLWMRVYLACPVADILPDLAEPSGARTLTGVAAELAQTSFIRLRADIETAQGRV